MIIKACGVSHVGKSREHNEDNLFVGGYIRDDLSRENVIVQKDHQTEPFAYAVFDGLGGGSYGEVASRIAAEIFREKAESGLVDADVFVSEAHKAIRSFARDNKINNIGTTAAALQIRDRTAHVFNVGDSKVYLFRNGQLKRLTKDHSMVQLMIDSGLIKESERGSSPYAADLTQYLGMTSEEDFEPEARKQSFSVMPGDCFILCSDGLTSEVEESRISMMLTETAIKDPETIAVDLVVQAAEKGRGRDNVTVIAVVAS